MNEIIKKNGLTFGLIVGAISIVSTTIMYVTDIKLFVSISTGLIIFAVNLIIAIVGVAKTKKALGGFMSFKEAFTSFFIIMAIGSLIGVLYMMVLFNFIDPETKPILKEHVIKTTVEWLQKANTPAAKIKEQVETLKKEDGFSVLSMVKSYFGGLLMYAVIGLIVAVALKRNKEVYN